MPIPREPWHPPEPTVEQCSENAAVYEDDRRVGYAIFYPQMGGYCGKAVAVCEKGWSGIGPVRFGGCIEIYVWHDGEFPFSEDDDDGRSPAHIHICDPEQFVRFGKTLDRLNRRNEEQINADSD